MREIKFNELKIEIKKLIKNGKTGIFNNFAIDKVDGSYYVATLNNGRPNEWIKIIE